jgi:hypothetical protein
MDGVKNGTESAKDCGGSCPTKCGIGQTCNGPADCTANNCLNGVCAPACATCSTLGYTCGSASDGCGHTLNCGSCASPQTCNGYGTDVCGLVLDDFSGSISTNLLGGQINTDHINKSIVNGQLKFSWDGSSNYDDYQTTFRSDSCDYDLSQYSKIRFQLQASASGKPVTVYLASGSGSCPYSPSSLLSWTVTPTTSLAFYEHDISGFAARSKAVWVEFDPQIQDSTTYYVDNIEFGTPNGGGGNSCATCASLGGYNCGTAPDGCGNTLNCGTCTSPQICGGYGANICGLVLDDFSGSSASTNKLGGQVNTDNLTDSLVNGELKFSWNHSSDYDDYQTAFRSNACEYNLSSYTSMRFQLQGSVAGKAINVVLAMGDGSCPYTPTSIKTWTITSTTSLDWYPFDISGVSGRNKAMFVELDPQVLDGTTYYVDNIEFK